MAVNMKMDVFQVILFRLLGGYNISEVLVASVITLVIEAGSISEMTVTFYQATQGNNPAIYRSND
jgi:hypothetical protein